MSHIGRILFMAVVAIGLAVASASLAAAPGKSQGKGGWEPSADHSEFALITLQVDPLDDPEPACVALQIGINLLRDSVPVGDAMVEVIPADEVVLFPTLGGVQLVNPANGVPAADDPEFDPEAALNALVCDTPAGPATRSLNQLLGAFLEAGGEVVACPLCTNARDITTTNFGDMVIIGNAVDVHELFLYADKVIDF